MPAKGTSDRGGPRGSPARGSPAKGSPAKGSPAKGPPPQGWAATPPGEHVVISGMACRMPKSDNADRFRENLLAGVDLISDDGGRWGKGFWDIPDGFASLSDLSRFDASFFGILPKIANHMDPGQRIALELTHEALVDAGVNPAKIRGCNAGTYVGFGNVDADGAHYEAEELAEAGGYEFQGTNRAMFANKLAFYFDLKGPSVVLDSACASSSAAFTLALQDIRLGHCDMALVGGVQVTLTPKISRNFALQKMLSPTGRCHTFDASADGYARSEAAVFFVLQKVKDAKRVYATVIHAESNADGYKPEGVSFPSTEGQASLMEMTYRNAGVSPLEVSYMEAHGTGTPAGDPVELAGIARAMCPGRTTPLLVGSLKSNMGHSEGASGMASLAKLVIAMETGVLPANLHYKSPNPAIPSLLDGTLKVVSENTPWSGGYAGLNNFGFGGSNVHTVVRSNQTEARPPHPAAHAPRLALFAGRTPEAVELALAGLQANADNVQMQALLQENSGAPPAGFPCRGYVTLNRGSGTVDVQDCPFDGDTRPVWFVFSGMGCQWPGMGRELMDIRVFRESIQRSHDVLKPFGVDLLRLIQNGTEEDYKSTVNCQIGICSVQIAMVDLLRELGIEPQGMFGHSAGEAAAQYCDGRGLAADILSSTYSKGVHCADPSLPTGGMAAVGLSWEEAKARCPPGVVAACHNAQTSVTVSGERKALTQMIQQLEAEGVFVREVDSSGRAFHSPLVAKVADNIRADMAGDCAPLRPFTKRFLSTSIPEARWEAELNLRGPSEYMVNNLTEPVLFHEAVQHIPDNAIVLEIGPHGLFQGVLKKSLPRSCTVCSMMKKQHPDNLEFLFSNLGKVYAAGYTFDSLRLHEPVAFPVDRGTPMLAPLVQWDHSQQFDFPTVDRFLYGGKGGSDAGACVFKIDASTPGSADYSVVGHRIDGRLLYPGTGYLVLAWKALAKLKGLSFDKMAVAFEDVYIKRATILPASGQVTFEVNILPGKGLVEIREGGGLVMTGRVSVPSDPVLTHPLPRQPTASRPVERLNTGDVYKALKMRGYEYGPSFQGIVSVAGDGQDGVLRWRDDYTPFIDAMLQTYVMSDVGNGLVLPTRFRSVRIDPRVTESCVRTLDDQKVIDVRVDPILDVCASGGVEISGFHTTVAPRKKQSNDEPLLREYSFVPFVETALDAVRPDLVLYTRTCRALAMEHLQAWLQRDGLQMAPSQQKWVHDTVDRYRMKMAATAERRLVDTLAQEETHTLLKVLGAAYDSEKGAPAEVLSQSSATLRGDKLLANMRRERVLKPLLDIVMLNAEDYQAKVTEIEGATSQLYQDAVPLMTLNPSVKVKYLITGAQFKGVDLAELESLEVETVTWDRQKVGQEAPAKVTECDLVVLDNVLHREGDLKQFLGTVKTLLKSGGFLLVAEPTEDFSVATAVEAPLYGVAPGHLDGRTCGPYCDASRWVQLIQDAGLDLVARKSDGLLNTLFLFRNSPQRALLRHQDVDVIDVTATDCTWIEKVKDAWKQNQARVKAGEELREIWITADNCRTSGILGLLTCLRREKAGHVFKCLFNTEEGQKLPPSESDEFRALLRKGLAMMVLKDSQWGAYHTLALKTQQTVNTRAAYVNVLTKGDLASLSWIESPLKDFNPASHPDKDLCDVIYTALNFRDIMLATGKLPPDAIPGKLADKDCLLGLEFSGLDPQGRRVMGLLEAKGLATVVDVSKDFLWEVPESWSLQEAATVPVVYATVFYALVVRGRIRRGDRVLVHSGSGGVGQAAIAVALHYGCEVFTTVGTQEKRAYLLEKFPKLTNERIANTRDLSFEDDILRATGGAGVDVVLNSLAEEKLQASVRLLAPHGRFLEIGKYDLSENNPLGLSFFLRNTTFHGILLDALFEPGNPEWPEVYRLVADGIRSGAVRPIRSTVFGNSQVEEAFRYMAQGQHIGKVLIKVRDEPVEGVLSTRSAGLAALPRFTCHPDKSYIVTGGLGGFGLELARWLVQRGARHLVLTSRTGITNGYQSRSVRLWREAGVKVAVSLLGVADEDEARALLREAAALGPVGGIFHLAVALKDAYLDRQTAASFRQLADTKALGAIHLDRLSRQMCAGALHAFVTFSSVASTFGNAGQTNYGLANSSMERVCELRREQGLPGLCVQWGAIGEVGVFHNMLGDVDEYRGYVPQSVASCLTTLDKLLNQPLPVVTSYVAAERKRPVKAGESDGLIQAVAHILGIKDVKKVKEDMTLNALGLDSLMGAEVKQALARYDVDLPLESIRELTFKGLKDM